MPVDYSKLTIGQEISHRTYSLDADTIARYVEAVGDGSGLFDRADSRAVAPPMSVAALGLRGVISDLEVTPGTLHVGQEMEFAGSVRVGETLVCRATVAQNSVRGGRRFLAVDVVTENGEGRRVMWGKSTLLLAA